METRAQASKQGKVSLADLPAALTKQGEQMEDCFKYQSMSLREQKDHQERLQKCFKEQSEQVKEQKQKQSEHQNRLEDTLKCEISVEMADDHNHLTILHIILINTSTYNK